MKKMFIILFSIIFMIGCKNSIIDKPDVDSRYTKFLNENNFSKDYTITTLISTDGENYYKMVFSKYNNFFARAAYDRDGKIKLRSFNDEYSVYNVDETGQVKKEYVGKNANFDDDIRRFIVGDLLFRKSEPKSAEVDGFYVEEFEKNDSDIKYFFKDDGLKKVLVKTPGETIEIKIESIEDMAMKELFGVSSLK
ncbi:MAG: hypothetical protein MSH08_02210 [Ezakiella sp.]|nr:hypothetical protein [Ezakiella sp.]MDD7472278.1 hypothetical protein [Bacillota bacterium]MDY3923016.1 hypothetical protein [Ezakiella sp.]